MERQHNGSFVLWCLPDVLSYKQAILLAASRHYVGYGETSHFSIQFDDIIKHIEECYCLTIMSFVI